MKEHLTNEDIVLLFYGEAAEPGTSDQHLSSCAECQSEFQRVRAFLEALPPQPVPERGADFETRLWRKLQPVVARPKPKVLPFRIPWRMALATAAVAVLAFIAGRSTIHPPALEPASAGLTEKAKQRILAVAVVDHLERSQTMMTEWMNLRHDDAVSLDMERVRAEDLLRENRLYRQTAAVSGDPGVAVVLEDLERVLLDIVHSPAKPSERELDQIQQRIDGQGTLFKVRLVRENLSSPAARL